MEKEKLEILVRESRNMSVCSLQNNIEKYGQEYVKAIETDICPKSFWKNIFTGRANFMYALRIEEAKHLTRLASSAY